MANSYSKLMSQIGKDLKMIGPGRSQKNFNTKNANEKAISQLV